MTYKIQGQNPFQILSTNFSIGPSNEGYTLQISADGNDWSDLFSVGANTTRMVTGVASGSYYRMSGNNSEVTVNWRTQCNDGGSGGGSGAQGPQGPAGGGGDSAQTMTLINNAIANNNANLEDGDPIVGMAKQLYSPDGVTSLERYLYRTTAGSEDIGTGPAELIRVGGHLPSYYNGAGINVTYTPGNGEDVSVEYNKWALYGELGNETDDYTYSYDGTDWTPALPDAITLDGIPEDGASITISVTEASWTPIEMRPEDFVSVGLNSYNKDSDTEICSTVDGDRDNYEITIKPVRNLEDGYVVYSTTSAITNIMVFSDTDDAVATEIVAGALYVAYPNDEFPYISITTNDKDSICVHPRWSGIKDDVYEEYTESRINLADFPELYALSNDEGQYDYVDIERGVYVQWIDKEAFSWSRLAELEDDGAFYDTDGEYIYTLLDEPNETPITVPDLLYTANDFGVEYYCANGELIDNSLLADWNEYNEFGMITETFYMNNLVDKLRRINGLVHLNNLNGTGNENTIYECDGLLWFWSDNGGTVAEWTDSPATLGASTNYGLIYSHIPDGTILFEYKYQYGDVWRSIVKSGTTLLMVETGVTKQTLNIGNTTYFQTSQYGNSYKINVYYGRHYIGFSCTNYISFQNVWSGQVTTGHWCIVDHTNNPYMPDTYQMGVPKWNSKGQVVGQTWNRTSKVIYWNSTGYSNSSTLFAEGNVPQRLFVPTGGGVAGQVLTSTGGEEPSWATMIKAVKITSDAYEALQTKDPNTLYLIVDE